MRPRFLAPFLLLFLAFPAPAKTAPNASAGSKPSPRFDLPTRAGTVSLDSLRGKVVLVDFWASWCDPCRRSFPWLSTLYERYSSRGLVIVAIDLDKNREAANEFLEEHPARFLVAFDPAGKTAEAFKVSAMPSSYLVGPTGTLLYSHAGFDPKNTGMLETLIREACPQ